MAETDVTASFNIQNMTEFHKIAGIPANTKKLVARLQQVGLSGQVDQDVVIYDSVENPLPIAIEGGFPFLQDNTPVEINAAYTVNNNQSVTFNDGSGGIDARLVSEVIQVNLEDEFEIQMTGTVTTGGSTGDAGETLIRPHLLLTTAAGRRLLFENAADNSKENASVYVSKTNGVTAHDIDFVFRRVAGTIDWDITDNGLVANTQKTYVNGGGNKDRIVSVQLILDVECNTDAAVATTVVWDSFAIVGDKSFGLSGAPGTGLPIFTPVASLDLLTNGKLGDLSVGAGAITTWSLPESPAGLAIAGTGNDEIHRTAAVTQVRDVLVKAENATGYWVFRVDLVDTANVSLPSAFPALNDAGVIVEWDNGVDGGSAPVLGADSITFSAGKFQKVLGQYCALAAPISGDFDFDAVLGYTTPARTGDPNSDPNLADLLTIKLKLQDANGDVITVDDTEIEIGGSCALFPGTTEAGNAVHFERRGTDVTGYITREGLLIPIPPVTVPATTVTRVAIEVSIQNANGNSDLVAIALTAIALTDVA